MNSIELREEMFIQMFPVIPVEDTPSRRVKGPSWKQAQLACNGLVRTTCSAVGCQQRVTQGTHVYCLQSTIRSKIPVDYPLIPCEGICKSRLPELTPYGLYFIYYAKTGMYYLSNFREHIVVLCPAHNLLTKEEPLLLQADVCPVVTSYLTA